MRFAAGALLVLLFTIPSAAEPEDALLTRLKLSLSLQDPAIRDNILTSLNSLGGDGASAAPLLLPLLKDPDPVIRMNTASTIAQIASYSNETLLRLRETANDPDPGVREAAVSALIALGMSDAESIKVIAAALSASDATFVDSILDTLGARSVDTSDGDTAPIREVVLLLAAERKGVARKAPLDALAKLVPKREDAGSETRLDAALDGLEDEQALAALFAESIADPARGVVIAAGQAATSWYDKRYLPAEVKEALLAAAGSPDNQIRTAVLSALAAGTPDDEIDQALLGFLIDSDHTNRHLAVEKLAGRPSDEAVQALTRLVADPAAMVRRSVTVTLASYGAAAEAAGPAVATLLRDPTDSVRAAAATALGAMGGLHRDVRTALIAASSDSHPDVRLAAMKSIGALMLTAAPRGDVASADALLATARAGLQDRDANIRRSSAEAIAATAPALLPALTVLREMVRSADEDLRDIAAAAIVKFGAEAAPASKEIMALLVGDNDSARSVAARALVHLHPPPAEAREKAIAMLDSSEACVVAAAIDTLSRIGGKLPEDRIIAALIDRRFECSAEEERVVLALARMDPSFDEALLAAVAGFPDEDLRQGLFSPPSRKPRITALVKAARLAREPRTLSLLRPDGKPVELTVGNDEIFIAVASWCGYSRNLRDELSRPEVRRVQGSKKVHFVFTDEWPGIRKKLEAEITAKGGEPTAEELDAMVEEMKLRVGGGPLYDPTFLEELPGDWYVLPASYKQERLGFPSPYDRGLQQFEGSVKKALDVTVNLPAEIFTTDRDEGFY